MFSDFKPMRGSLWKQEVNTYLGIAFLLTVSTWAAMLVLNVKNGSDPITDGLSTVIANEMMIQQ